MAEPTQITQETLTAPVTVPATPVIQTPAPVQNIAPVTVPVAPPPPPAVPVIPVAPAAVPVIPGAGVTAAPVQNIVAQPITPAVAAQLTVDMNTLTEAVDKAYGRV